MLFASANDLFVRQTTGDQNYAISTISHITFPAYGSGVVLSFTDGTSKSFPRSMFVSLRFNGNISGADFVTSDDHNAIIYNNASAEIVVVGNECNIQVFATNGVVVAEGEGTSLDISNLLNGTYVVKAGSLTSKIVKR